MIDLQGIEKTYAGGTVTTPVLKGLSLRIDKGEYVAVTGASGSGKTTLMNVIGCLDKPTGGRYLLDGTDVTALDDDSISRLRNHTVGFVFQQFNLLERATALRNVMLPFIYTDEYPADADTRAARSLEAVGLSHRMKYRPNELSGGEQQRVAIARALVMKPEVILADEPTGNLDKRSGLEVLAVLGGLHSDGHTIVLVTHDESVAAHAGRIVGIEDGRIAEDRVVDSPADAQKELTALGKEGDKE